MPRLQYSILILLVCTLGILAGSARAQSHTLRSDHLEVQLAEEPYGFEVREASSGEVLLGHAETAFQDGIIPSGRPSI